MFIELKNISKSYGKRPNEVEVLKSLNLNINKGEMTAIMGKSGCGKSTLINILGGLTDISEGEYCFEGQKLNFCDKKRLSEFRFNNVSYIVQNFALINSKTAYQNIELPLIVKGEKDDSDTLIKKYAEALGLSDKLERFPYELSGGECQRVAIARALVNSPKLILADEPTGSLDSENETVILDILTSIAKTGTTVVIVTHDLSVASRCHRIINMKDGKIAE